MNVLADDITTFCGKLPPDEYEQRRRLRTCKNAAAFKATRTTCADARALCWMVTERTHEWLYTPASVEDLGQIVRLCRRLLIVADQIEEIEVQLYEQ